MQPATMLPKLTETRQTIIFQDDENGDPIMAGEVYATDVFVTTNAGNHSHGSSKVKLKSLVDYNWEAKPYSGRLLTVHISGKYLAYCIKAPNPVNPGTWRGMVRVVYFPEPGSDKRALIKGMKGEVQDLAFAHIENEVVLACIDEFGNFYVNEIEVTDSGLRCTPIAEIIEDSACDATVGSSRVVWCPYIPDEDDAPSDDVARLLLTTHGRQARMWNVSSIVKLVDADGCASVSTLLDTEGVLTASDHSAAIVDAAFSPDGTALATASLDGYVMFFQVFMHNEGSPRCLHKWQPHNGKPLSCLFFLDNHRHYNSDVQFWKFAVTGAENNTVIKIWSCKSWNCIQTITFEPCLGTELGPLGLKAMLDTSASYLLLSDFKSRSLYVLNMARDKDDSIAYCKSVSEFLLPYPVLSFCIVDAEEEVVKSESRCSDPFQQNGSSGDGPDSPDQFDRNSELAARDLSDARRVRLRLYIVQPKGLQEGELLYTPPAPRDRVHANVLADLSSLTLNNDEDALEQQRGQLLLLLQPGLYDTSELNLMTPQAFSSPGKHSSEELPLPSPPSPPAPSSPSAAPPSPPTPTRPARSGGSSPSMEVQRIMTSHDQYKDLEEEPIPTAVPEVIPNGTEPYPNDIYVSPEKPETTWPEISLAQITSANRRKASSDKSSSQSLNNSLNVSAVERAASEDHSQGLSVGDKNRLESLEQKLDKLCDLVTQQSRELRSLRTDVSAPRELLETALHAHGQRTAAAVDAALANGWERISVLGEAASSLAAKAAGEAAAKAAGEAAKAAAEAAAKAAGQGAARALEPLAHALRHELANKLTATDHLLRENIDKLAGSKTVMERLSTAIAKSLTDMVRESFRASLFESVVPVMEKAHAQIFRQINHAFQNGTKEFASHTEACARAAAERGGAAATAALRAALDRHAAALDAAGPTHAVLVDTIKEVAHSVLEKEVAWWREQTRAAVQASRAQSPPTPAASHVSAMDRQMQVAQIQSLMSGGDLNGAFQLALSASDLALVVAACRAADPAAVFGPPCKLKQPVLLSLVQQLAADMARDTHLKHRYLEEAVMNLDTTNPVTREHLPAVVRELQKQVVAFLNSHQSHALTRQFKMLLMATESLVKGSV